MELQGRDLNIRMRGQDVELLQQELRQLDFTIEDEAGYFGSSTCRAVEQFQEQHDLGTTGVVDERTATLINEAVEPLSSFIVCGHVRKLDTSPLTGALVRASDKDLRHEERLGDAITDGSGRYEIAYTAAQFRRAEKKRADLIIRVFDQEDQEVITSDILFNAQPEETVDLMIGGGEYRGPSEYEQLLTEITPVLENVPLTELNEKDISFLSSETGLVSRHIEFLALASKRAQETELPPETFYGFARHDFSIATLEDIFRQERHTLHNALITALAGNIIPERLRASIDSILDQLNERAVTEELEGESSMGALLRSSPILQDDTERQKTFIRVYREYEGPNEAFWKELPEKYPEFAHEDVIKELQITLELGRITLNHPPLVQIIQDELRQNDSLFDLRKLATWEITDWCQRIDSAGTPPNIPGETEDERLKYAEAIFQAVEISFPTAVIAHRLGNAPEDLQNLPGADTLLQVVKQDSSFELGKENIDLYLEQDADPGLKSNLKSWQRVYRMSPPNGRYDVMRSLKTYDLDSAQSICRMGYASFKDEYSHALGGSKQMDTVWNSAGHINAMVLSLVTQYSGRFNAVTPKAIPYQPVDEVEGIPNWKELFGSLDFCACEHCKSVYGPAAYFVDLLYFLKSASRKNKKSPLTVLLNRRLDLSEIELSCANTNTVMPYVDLVNEVLENALAWFILKHSVKDLNDSVLNPIIREKFDQAGYRLSHKASLSTIYPGNQWRVTDEASIYVILQQKGSQHIVSHLLKNQTRANQDELSAIPEHLNEHAYLKLAKAVYPWDLPFDLWFEESRVYLKHLGLKRYHWMEKFRKDKPLDAAYDHLGITEKERELITGKLGTSEYKFWGLKQQQDYEKLRSIGVFLKQAGFDNKPAENCKSLRRLLVGTLFVKKNSTITISVDAGCNFDKTKIDNDKDASSVNKQQQWASILNRARRFLRLQRKLEWTTYELDKTITTFKANLDGKKGDDFLQQISFVERLRAELNVPLVEMLCWWGLIDTAEDRVEEENSKKEKSLYEQLFLNKTVSDTANAIFKLKDTELVGAKEKIASHTAAVVSALVISLADLKLLLTEIAREEAELQNKKIDPNDLTLNLNNLSYLYRMVSLAKALRLSIKEFLAAKALINTNPFKTPQNTLNFVRNVREIGASNFSIMELNYLLRHRYELADSIAPTAVDIAKIMSEIRSGLHKIHQETPLAPDPQGTTTKAKLSLLVPENRINDLLEVINGDSKENESVQNKLIDELLKPYLDTQAIKKQLVGQNAPKKTERAERFEYLLKHLLPYLRNLLSENFVKQKLSTALNLDADITALLLETLLKGQIDAKEAVLEDFLVLSDNGMFAEYYKNTNHSGISEKQQVDPTIALKWAKNPLLQKGENAANFSVKWSGMVQVEQSGTYTFHVMGNGNTKLWVNNQKIIDFWTNTQGSIDQEGKIKLEAGKFYDILLKYRTNQDGAGTVKLSWTPPSAPKQVIPTNKLLPSLPKQAVPENRLVPPTALLFCGHSYCLLHKLAMLITKFEIQVDELDYLSEHGNDFEMFNLNKFPIKVSKNNTTLFKQWKHLYEIFSFRSHFSQADIRLIDVFEAAYQSTTAAKKRLIQLTGWDNKELDDFADGLKLSKVDFKQGHHLLDLYSGFRVFEQLGISAKQLIDWTSADLGVSFADLKDSKFQTKKFITQALRKLIKAKYGTKQWLKVVKPLRDELREKQRNVLVSYLVHDYGLKDANELYDRFLIDVEMGPCMLTSRIKQAIGVVQLFVQRCLMNLEPDVELLPQSVKEWKWRKYYRVWEANRKVFLYPENWIEPELRDDKSPFFEDLENELLQNEMTKSTAETAILNFLEKLDEVGRLDIVGMYEQKDGMYEQKEQRTTASVLHVLGRTVNTPHIYYYRRWIDEDYWTAWERVDLDIEGNHLIPVVWNRRLYLFWPIFRKGKTDTGSKKNELPDKLDIRLAWSEYKNGKWQAKKVATEPSETLSIHKGASPNTDSLYAKALPEINMLSFKAYVSDKGELTIKCYAKHDDTTWRPFAKFQFSGCQGKLSNSIITPSGSMRLFLQKRSHIDGMLFIENKVQIEDIYTLELIINIEKSKPHYQLVLQKTPGTFRILYPHQYSQFTSQAPFFYQDDNRTFFVKCSGLKVIDKVPDLSNIFQAKSIKVSRYYNFNPFYHPYVCEFVKQLNRLGIDGLLDPEPDSELYRQMATKNKGFFAKDYLDLKKYPDTVVDKPYPVENIDFSFRGAYSQYNWELFFHAPLLIADRLSQNQRFEEAMQWFHYIFDPTETSGGAKPACFWKVRPFYEPYQKKNGKPKRIQELMKLLNKGDKELEKQVKQWQKDPFKPHLIARYRTAAYMKTTVMKYLDNLIAWGDQLFRRDTMESNVEAAQLYILAAEILGDRPKSMPAKRIKKENHDLTFSDLEEKLDPFANADIENLLLESPQGSSTSGSGQQQTLTLPHTLYFCIPNNKELLKYWDTVEDRLFKIRHCMNIKGIVRQLPLFQPPIDPALLVRATAAGIDISSVLNDLYAPLPHYRFQIMLQKATELCADVRSLGASLLSTLEKKDAEELTLLRSRHELKLLKAVRKVKKQQIDDADKSLEGLKKASELAGKKRTYYETLKKNGLNTNEELHLTKMANSIIIQSIGQGFELAGSIAHIIPTSTTTVTPPQKEHISYGGRQIGSALQAYGKYVSILGSIESYQANRASIKGKQDRRAEEWQFQIDITTIEMQQIENQIKAAEIRMAIAENELKNHDLQAENAKEVDTYMRNKFTNKQLYSWMVSQISGLYFQSYKLSYDLAKQAEKTFKHELGISDSDYIQFGYWDSLKKGLLSGERLHYDLKRMDAAYLEQNKREYEITKHISLTMIDPIALIMLKEKGECYVNLPEAIFDLDYPGHYMRRIKSVSLTIPCVTGPYTSVNCTLTLLSNRIRKDSNGIYDYKGVEDKRFQHNFGAIQSIATSSAQNDSGLFELNFRDERYLPFEGAGVISEWRLELPDEFRQFDYNTISDVIFHMSYTARDGGDTFKKTVNNALKKDALKKMPLGDDRTGLMQVFSAKHEFSNAWHQFLHPRKTDTTQALKLDPNQSRFPSLFKDKTIKINTMHLFIKLKNGYTYQDSSPLKFDLKSNGDSYTGQQFQVAKSQVLNLAYAKPFENQSQKIGKWSIEVDLTGLSSELCEDVKIGNVTIKRLKPDAFEDLIMVCQYTAEKK